PGERSPRPTPGGGRAPTSDPGRRTARQCTGPDRRRGSRTDPGPGLVADPHPRRRARALGHRHRTRHRTGDNPGRRRGAQYRPTDHPEGERTVTGTQTDDAPAESYAAATAEIDTILTELERDDLDIDLLAAKVRRAAELLEWCRER